MNELVQTNKFFKKMAFQRFVSHLNKAVISVPTFFYVFIKVYGLSFFEVHCSCYLFIVNN